MNTRARGRSAEVRAQAIRSANIPLGETESSEDYRTRVAVVVPAHNERVAIGAVLRGVPRDSSEVLYRTFVCDDGSDDETGVVAAAAGATILRHSRNLGIGAALTTGFVGAREWSPDIFVQMDADGQHNPATIPQLIEPILRGKADYVIGSRFLTGAVGMSSIRRVGVRIYSRVVRFLSGLSVTDVTSGFRAFRADAYDLLSIRSKKNWAVEMTLRAGLSHLRTVEISTPYLPRYGGNSQFVLRRLFLIYHFRAILQIFRAFTAPTAMRARRTPIPVPSREPALVGVHAHGEPSSSLARSTTVVDGPVRISREFDPPGSVGNPGSPEETRAGIET